MAYRKRRIIRSTNKNAERSQRNQTVLPPLKTFFPEVKRLTLDLSFSNRQGHVLQEDHLEYGPEDPVNFLAPCPGGCDDGETNLQGKIESLVRSHQSNGEGRAQCVQPLSSASDVCACDVKCEIQITYQAS
jgi:hypothetical protein